MAISRTECELCGEEVLVVPHSATGRLTKVDVLTASGGTIVIDFEHGTWTKVATVPASRRAYEEDEEQATARKKVKPPCFYRSHTRSCVGIIDEKTELLIALKEQTSGEFDVEGQMLSNH